jgi:glycosyltransferase involved in cell wall biosynthesis
MSPDAVELSIGLPVYNGDRFLAETLENLLDQSFGGFELIISDNGSTDRTAEICRDYSARDARIRYVRHEKNRGAVFNWNYVVGMATGEYFKWASVNDYLHRFFLERCLEVLRNHHDVVLCYTATTLVTDDKRPLDIDPQDIAVLDTRAGDRFVRLMDHQGLNNAQSGVIRREDLLGTRLDRRYPHGDKVLMAELAARGKFWLIEDPLFFRRWGPLGSSIKRFDESELQAFLAPDRRHFTSFNLWTRYLDFCLSALHAPIPWHERLSLLRTVLRRLLWNRWALLREIRSALIR